MAKSLADLPTREISRRRKNTLVNLSLAHQALGQYPSACWKLTDALEVDNNTICRNVNPPSAEEVSATLQTLRQQPNTLLTLKALQELGITLRVIGNLQEAESVLQLALASAQRQKLSTEANAIKLSLANTQADVVRQAQNRYSLSDDSLTKAQFIQIATKTLPKVAGAYQTLADNNPDNLQARLNWLGIFLSINKWTNQDPSNPEMSALKASLLPHVDSMLNQALVADYAKELPIQSIYSRIKLAQYLLEIQKSNLPISTNKHPLIHAFKLVNSARNDALRLKNERAESFAIGVMGKLYKTTKQADLAQKSFYAARILATASDSSDAAYEWEWELAQLYQEQGQSQKAIAAYERSLKHLDQVRGDLLPIDSELQFRFVDKIKPVYQQYIRLLLSSGKPNLEQVILTNERLQIAQIENFLHCGKLIFVSTTEIEDAPTTIHILELEHQFEILVTNNGKWARFSADGDKVRGLASKLLVELQDEQFSNTEDNYLLAESQALYQVLLAPIEKQGLLPKQESTIVFVTDGILSNIPLSMLHDGKQYLVERYSITNNLGRLQAPETTNPQKLKLLIAGISKASPSLSAPQIPPGLDVLPETEEEATLINSSIKSATLLNQDFTADGLRRKLSNGFSALHISTHGQFSSDPNKTFLLAWDKPLALQELDSILRQETQVAANNLELLFLSACQTAKGDQLSSLGIAGVSIQAGARSTIAALWLVNAESTAQLAGHFYQSLVKGRRTKAEALREAQLKLLGQPKTRHPFYWAPFFLSGSWF
ncbi:MAG: CHAT domain-containing protein [Acaryochloris sp. RU_4_1]|nr:CHAT domain-containing protein [Acaryochloris sp. RU_4_1]